MHRQQKPSTVSLPDWLLLALTTSPSLVLPGALDSFLTQNCPWRTRHKKSAKLLISSLNALVQSAGFSLKTQPRLLLLPLSSHGLTHRNCLLMGTPNSVIQPLQKILNFAARLILLAPATNTQHIYWKNCTGFPFQNVLNIESVVCVSVL